MSHDSPIVLVVDDDVSMRESLELLLESAGWRCRTFASAQEFLACSEVPQGRSCLVLDANLPDLTGLALQKRVAIDRTDVPIIFISGDDDPEITARAMKAGAVACLTKPLDADVLLGAIRHAFGPIY